MNISYHWDWALFRQHVRRLLIIPSGVGIFDKTAVGISLDTIPRVLTLESPSISKFLSIGRSRPPLAFFGRA
jgi:hypothetical protein